MKLSNYLKEKKESVAVVLLGVSVLFGIMILVKVRGFFVTSAWAEDVVKRAVAQSKPDANDAKEHLAESKAIADKLKKNNLFAPPTPKKHPVNQVLGIMGSEALINGKWYKVGDNVGDAKVVAIEPALVRIEWDGKEKVFAPMQAASSSGPGARPEMASRTEGGPGAGAAMVVVGPDRGPGRFGEEGFRGMRERFQNMSEEERQAFRERMRERFGGRRGPGGEGGRGGERGRGGRGR